ncbi:MAG: tetratricopeptide repeat protein, partial [Nitrospinota bacterium]|nr:tetratricopeptide repeat protein [Nitrospinota bacterium]
MKRSLIWITSIIFILSIAGNATAGNLSLLIVKNYMVSAEADSFYTQGVEQAKVGEYNRAERLFEKALQKDSNHVDALSYLGHVQASKGQHSQAIKTAKRALKLAPTHEGANGILIRVYETQGAWDKMIEPLNTLTQNYTNNAKYQAKLGEA